MKWWCEEAEGEPNLQGNYHCKKKRRGINIADCYHCPDRKPWTVERKKESESGKT